MKTTDHKLVNKCISDSHVCGRFHSLVCGCCLSQSHKSKFAFETKKKRTTKILSLLFGFLSMYIWSSMYEYWLFWHIKHRTHCALDFDAKDASHMCVWLTFECFFHYVPITNSIFIWLGSTWAQPHTPKPALNSSELKLSIQHSAHTHSLDILIEVKWLGLLACTVHFKRCLS